MVKKSADNSAPAIAPFLTKCYDMVDDRSTDEVISWSYNGNSFVIWDMTRFTVQLLPKFFKHGNFSSFMRQLNIYGFRKTDSDRWEFANDGFIRGQKNLLKNIIRRKHSHGLSQHQSTPQIEKTGKVCDEDETNVLWKEVESLNTDKNALMQELSKLRQVHETTENKVLLLRERLQGMEKNQQQMLSFLVMAMQSPSFLVQFLQPKESTWRVPESGKKTMLREVIGDDSESMESDGMIVRFQPSMETDEASMSIKSPPSESSSDKAKDFFMNIDFLTMPMDEHFFTPENHGPLSLPDLAEDNILKQFLLASPFLENSIDATPEDSAVFGTQLEKFQTIESLTEEMEKSEDWESRERSQSLDLLTEQLGLLISEGSG